MSATKGSSQSSVMEALVASIRTCAAFDQNDQVPPAVILWPDEERAWAAVIPRLRAAMPELLTLGAYDVGAKTGPAIWIKAMLGKGEDGRPLLPEADWPEGAVPVVYLPGVGRNRLRAIQDCPADLKLLCELQFRGVMWVQLNGKDWTPRAFLQSGDGGLGLDLAGDSPTLGAMKQALAKLLDVPVDRLRNRTLDARDFHELLTPDPARMLLDWMSDAAAFRTRAGADWQSFCTVAKDKFGYDPEKSDITKAGQLLAERQGAWAGVWSRFEENPALYPGVRNVIRRSKPAGTDTLFRTGLSVYPQDNEAAEKELREELNRIGDQNEAAARRRLAELEAAHGPRRSLVWAKLGEAPLAAAMQALAELALLSDRSLGGGDRDEAASAYADSGWRTDDAAMRALAAVRSSEDLIAVGRATAAVYGPWLEKSATNLQQLIRTKPLQGAGEAKSVSVEPGECLLFADGLRMDLGQRLAAELAKRGLRVEVSWRWSAVPTVTASAKPAASPVASKLNPRTSADNFLPRVLEGNKELTADRFRALLKNAGVQCLEAAETGSATGAGWVEAGSIDRRGHDEGANLAAMLEDEVRLLADRAAGLLAAGWGRVRVVTDHGWLLLPGGLPKVTMPSYVLDTRWLRCGSITEGASPECQQHAWHWNASVSIALAPGISCFRKGAEYAHGGLSLQECVTPVILVTASGAAPTMAAAVEIQSVNWNQLTGRVQVSGEGAVAVDLRADASDPTSSLLDSDKPRPIGAGGQAKIYAKDEADGADAEIVALDPDGNVMARLRTRVGME